MGVSWQYDWFEKWSVYSPHRTAVELYDTGACMTYAELNRCAARLARVLYEQYKVCKGDRVAVLADFSLEYIALFGAAQKSGFILVPVNYRLARPEVAYLMENAAPVQLIVEEKYAHLVPEGVSVCPMAAITRWCEEAVEHTAEPPFPAINMLDDDPVFILYTAGTTGFPKGALYTHGMLRWNSINTAMSLIVNTESRTVNVMPPFHTGGWNVLLTPFLHHGGYVCLMKKFDASAALQLLQEKAATIFMAVPTILQMMANDPGFAEATFPNMLYLIVGGEPMPIPLIERWHAKQVPVRQGYGMTEVGPNLTSLHQDDAIRKKGSIGRPNFYVQTRLVDDSGQDVEQGASGELWLRGPMVTPGYWQLPEASGKTFSPDGLWFRTGDLMRQDEEQYLYVVDRLKNMYKSGGENVYPAEVERVLQRYAPMAEVAVVGVPDAKWGEVGKAYIALQQGFVYDESDFIRYCQEHLAKFKVPKHIECMESLPKNDAGKIDRKALRALHKAAGS